MGKRDFYRRAQALAGCEGAWLSLVIAGPAAALGRAALWRDGARLACWPARDADVWRQLSPPAAPGLSVAKWRDSRVFWRPLPAVPRLVICGGGHVARALARLAVFVGLAVTVLEDRPEYARPERFPGATVLCQPFTAGLDALCGADSYFVLLTRGSACDVDCLWQILPREFAYLGMLGSARRREQVWQSLGAAGFTRAQFGRVHCPVGLALGAETPEELAVAILAELLPIYKARQQGQPFNAAASRRLAEPAATPQVLATIIACSGITPRSPGTQMLVEDDGVSVGTVGGGLVETEVVAAARQLRAAGGGCCLLDLANGDLGRVSVFLEYLAADDTAS